MAEVQINCVVKPQPNSPVQRIQELRGRILPDQTLWRGTPADAAARILEGHEFFTLVGTRRTYLERVTGRNSAPDYVRTQPNGRDDDNLLKKICKNS